MMVFFKNIPPTTQKSELVEFIKPAMKQSLFYRLFSLPGAIVDIALLSLLDQEKNKINAHGVVTIMPDSIATLVIQKLDRKVINGRRIVVREYHVRSEKNDPRKAKNDVPQDIIDKRTGDRRQYQLVPYHASLS